MNNPKDFSYRIQNGFISTKQSTFLPIYKKLNETTTVTKSEETTKENISSIFSFGDVVGFSCHDGYKFRGNRNLLLEFRLQCSTDGTWAGHVPDCVRLQCPTPKRIDNGKIFFLDENKTEIEVFVEQKIGESNISMSGLNGTEKMDESMDNETEIDLFEKLTSENDEEIENSRVEKKIVFVSGTKILLVCDPGFGTSQNVSRTCLENESWSSSDPECTKLTCPLEDHPVIGFLAANQSGNESDTNNEKSYQMLANNSTITTGNLYFFLEGNEFGDKFMLACVNDTKIEFETIGEKKKYENLTWACDGIGKWRIRHVSIDESNLAKLLINKIDICQRVTCSLPEVSISLRSLNTKNLILQNCN